MVYINFGQHLKNLYAANLETFCTFMAPKVKLHMIHQDAFKAGFMAACQQLPDNSIVHLTSRHDTLPTVAEVVKQWSALWNVSEVHLYENISEVPATGIDRRNKMWLDFTAVNNDIAAHPWQFQTAALDQLRSAGLKFKDVTLDTVRVCQDHFVAQSERAQAFLQKNKAELTAAAKSANSNISKPNIAKKVVSTIS